MGLFFLQCESTLELERYYPLTVAESNISARKGLYLYTICVPLSRRGECFRERGVWKERHSGDGPRGPPAGWLVVPPQRAGAIAGLGA